MKKGGQRPPFLSRIEGLTEIVREDIPGIRLNRRAGNLPYLRIERGTESSGNGKDKLFPHVRINLRWSLGFWGFGLRGKHFRFSLCHFRPLQNGGKPVKFNPCAGKNRQNRRAVRNM